MSSFYKRYEIEIGDELLRCLAALLIPFEWIESATNNFADENLIAQRPSGKFYRGKLRLQSDQMVDILVREFQMITDDNISEKMIVFLLKHKNVNPILHVTSKNESQFLVVNKFEPNGSLAKHLPGSTLTWTQRLSICIGVAHALRYIHFSDFVDEPGYYVIHGNIKSSKILLDEDWQPRLQGFECAMVAERNTLYVTGEYKGTLQYKDPAYEYTRGLTHKSDVFSFGVVLFEVLFGRKATSSSTPNEGVDDSNFAEFARLHWENKTLDEMIDSDLWKTMDLKSVENFSDVAYMCLKERREDRPNMEQVVNALEQSLKLQKNHEQHSLVLVKQTSSSDLQGESFEHLKIPLKDIISATENFNVKYQIGSGGFGSVYKAKLQHFDSRNSSALEVGDDGVAIRKICSTVAIKRIYRREDRVGEQGFIAEVQRLSNCKHPNIVSLLGFCEAREKILIYEYVPNGSLDSYLEQSYNYKLINLTWSRRIQICLDIAHGLDYLHSGLNGNEIILHRDIKSANILLDNNFRAKIADFGLSRLYTLNPNMSTVNTGNVAGTSIYVDPEYLKTGKLKRASDIYSFGVVLFEILSGALAYDEIHNTESEKGLPSRARRLSKEGSLKDIVDSNIKETDGSILSQSRRADQNSLDTFLNIAIQCLAETQDERPKVEDVIRELENALNFQKNNEDNLEILLEDINLATQSFSDCNCIGEGKLWKLYKGEVPQAISNAKGCTAIVAKRWSKSGQGHQQFSGELEFVFKHKHKNVIDLVGYCTKMEERIIVYEHSNRTLDNHLKDPSLTWIERLKISIDVASGLEFLHSGAATQETVMHGEIKSDSILVDGDWKAKISNLELITTDTFHQNMESVGDVDDHFLDPSIVEQGNVSKESDIYSLGVLLFEVLSGRLAKEEGCEGSLGPLAIRWCRDGELDEMVFEGIKDQIDPFSFDVFTSTAYSCFLHGQPNASELVIQLEEALEYQRYVEESPKVSRSDIKLASDKCIQEGRYWKLYEVQIPHANANGWATVYAKWWDNKSRQAHDLFFTELRILLKSKNKHIVAFVGYCNEMNEKIIVYEHASNGSLDKHLDNASLTWTKRLNICIEVAKGLQYLHESEVIKKISMKHGAIKSGSILIDGDWKVKIANLEFYPSIRLSKEDFDYGYGSLGYIESDGDIQSYVDVYALGVVLLEMFCGRLGWPEECEDQSHSLGPFAQRYYNEKGNLDELLSRVIIKEQIAPESLTAFQSIAIRCLETGKARPKASEVVKRLEVALDLQRYVEGSPQISLEEIKQGTQKFSDDKCVGKGRNWKLYEGKFPDANADRYTTALVKRLDSKSIQARREFFTELRNLFLYKDDGIIAIEGYCNEMDEKIIVYEHGYNRSLDKHLDDASLRWNKRLEICLDVALAVRRLYLKNNITHGDIRSGSIQIDCDWFKEMDLFVYGVLIVIKGITKILCGVETISFKGKLQYVGMNDKAKLLLPCLNRKINN